VIKVEVERRASLEAAARDARYQALRKIARDLSIRWVLLAHTASDQAETVLMRVLRGTGLIGLAGIPPRRGRYLRPLISASRDEILAYLEERGLEACRDPMNEDPRFLRSRVRHQWLPKLQEENPRLPESLVRLAQAAREQREVLDFAADQLLESARVAEEMNTYSVPKLVAAPAAVVKRALSCAAQSAGGEPLSSTHMEAAATLLRSDRGGSSSLDLPKVRMVREYDKVRWASPQGVAELGAAHLPEAVGLGLVVRRWQPGDRMRPQRLKGRSRKLSDLFTDRRVPREQRLRARVVTRPSDGEIVWAEHIGPAYGHDLDPKLDSGHSVAPEN